MYGDGMAMEKNFALGWGENGAEFYYRVTL